MLTIVREVGGTIRKMDLREVPPSYDQMQHFGAVINGARACGSLYGYSNDGRRTMIDMGKVIEVREVGLDEWNATSD